MEELVRDIRYSFRRLFRERGFTLAAVATLALGIGANTAIFTLINGILLKPLGYRDPEGIVTVWERNPSTGAEENEASLANYLDWRSQAGAFTALGAYTFSPLNLTGGDQPERVLGIILTPEVFQVLGVTPSLGRFVTAEDVERRERVAVLSHQLWQRAFGSDPAVLDKLVQLNGNQFRVVGVMPAGFRFPSDEAEIWVPLRMSPESASDRLFRYLYVIGRLKPGISMDQAHADLATVASRLEQAYPDANRGWTVKLVPLFERTVGRIRPVLWILFGTAAFVLLIALANLVSLFLARAAAHEKELAMRTALGARRGQLVRQIFVESLTVAALGGLCGALLATWGLDLLRAARPADLPRLLETSLDLRVVGFTVLISLLAGLGLGLIPSLKTTKVHLQEILKEGGRSVSGGRGAGRLRGTLVAAEIALALLLLIGAGLMIRSLVRLQQIDPGFDTEGVLTFNLSVPESSYPEGKDAARLIHRLVRRMAELPQVAAAGATTNLPLSGSDMTTGFLIQGRPAPEQAPEVKVRAVTPGYFAAMGIDRLQGRDFEWRDAAGAPAVAIVNRAWVDRHWNEAGSPVGRRLTVTENPPIDAEIVGVVADVRHGSLQEEAAPELYMPLDQFPFPFAVVVARTRSEPMSLVPMVREELRQLDSALPLARPRPLREIYAASFARSALYTRLLSLFAVVALVLAAVGTYGVMSYSTTQRFREIGIRIALGAGRGEILRMIVGQGMRLTLGGVAVGLVAAFLLTRVLASLLYGVSVTDPGTFGGTAVMIAGVALLACLLPAYRASTVDPVQVLRRE